MKYCYNCGRITTGEPLFCNFCGRTYDVKLCPRLHANPRNAEACSRCGSRDFSTPQPKAPVWAPVVQFVLSIVPGAVLVILSAAAVALFIAELATRPDMLLRTIPLFIVLGVLWWVWSELPAWFRRAIQKLLKRRREGRDRKENR